MERLGADNMKGKKILVVAAHPDDEMMGAGGTVVKWSSDNIIQVLILGEGIMARGGKGKKNVSLLRKDSQKANIRLLGKIPWFESFPDNRMDTIPRLSIVKVIERYVKKADPDMVLTHHYGDLNIDHQITFQAVMTAVRPQPGKKRVAVICFETPSATEWSESTSEKMFKPNLFVDVSNYLDHKIAALECYKTEMKPYPHSRSIEGIKIMGLNWGRQIGVKYAEVFEIIRLYDEDFF